MTRDERIDEAAAEVDDCFDLYAVVALKTPTNEENRVSARLAFNRALSRLVAIAKETTT